MTLRETLLCWFLNCLFFFRFCLHIVFPFCVFPFFQIWFCCMILFTLLLFQSPLYYVRNFLPLVNFFQNFSMPAVTHPITKPSNKTKNIPPTFGSPSSLTDPLPASESPPPALHCSPFSLFHHLFLSLWIIPSSLSLIIALLTYERNGDPIENGDQV